MAFRGGKGRACGLLFIAGIFSFSFYLSSARRDASSQNLASAPSETAMLPVGLEVGMRAPDFSLQDLHGKELRLSQLRGKGVILNFWSTWCKPCRAELPLMESFHQENKNGNQVEVVSVNINRETDNTVKDFAQSMGLTFPVLLDFQKEVARLYKIFAVPTSFVLDKKGVIVKKVFGEIELHHPQELLSMINGATGVR